MTPQCNCAESEPDARREYCQQCRGILNWDATRQIEAWNEAHELGTAVIVTLDSGRQVNGFTRSPAWKLGNDAVVSVSNGVGTYLLERVQAVTP